MGVLPILAALAEAMAAIVRGPAAIAADAPSFAALLAPQEDDDAAPDGATEPPRADDTPRAPIDALAATALVALTVPAAPALPAGAPAEDASANVEADAPTPATAGGVAEPRDATAAAPAAAAPAIAAPGAPAAAPIASGEPVATGPHPAAESEVTEGREPGRRATPGGVVAPTGPYAEGTPAATRSGGGGSGDPSAPSPLPLETQLHEAVLRVRGGRSASRPHARGRHGGAAAPESAGALPAATAETAEPSGHAAGAKSAAPAEAPRAPDAQRAAEAPAAGTAAPQGDGERAFSAAPDGGEPGVGVATPRRARPALRFDVAADREATADLARPERAGQPVAPTEAREGTSVTHRGREGDASRETPARAATPPPVPASPEENLERLLRADAGRAPRGKDGGEMRLAVTPDGLGPVEVRVVVREDAVHATVWARDDQAREALTTNRHALAEALGRSQLRLEGFTVGLGDERGPRQDLPETRHLPGAPAPRPAAPTAAAEPSPLPAAGRGLSLRA